MNLKTVKQFCKTNRAFTEGGLRWLIHNQCSNGLFESGALIKLGGRVLIDEDQFLKWVVSHNTPFNYEPLPANSTTTKEEGFQSHLEKKINASTQDRLEIFVHKSGLALKKATDSQKIQLVLNSIEREKLRQALV